MGQKINGIALRLGGRTWWWSSNLNKYEWEFINKIVTGVLKKENILISELVLKKYSRQNFLKDNMRCRTYDCQWESLNSIYKHKSSYGFPLINENKKFEDTLYISGLIFKPEISNENKRIRLLKTINKDWLKLENLLICSRLQSFNTNILLKEILDGFLTEILKSQFSWIKNVEYDFQFVTTPESNSLILGNWLELCLGSTTDKRSKDKRLLKMIFSNFKQKTNSWNKWVESKKW